MLLTSIQTLRTIPKRVAGDWREFRWFNALLAAATVLSVAFLVWGVEFSHRVWGTVELQLADAEQVILDRIRAAHNKPGTIMEWYEIRGCHYNINRRFTNFK
jgi:hypothetical protein